VTLVVEDTLIDIVGRDSSYGRSRQASPSLCLKLDVSRHPFPALALLHFHLMLIPPFLAASDSWIATTIALRRILAEMGNTPSHASTPEAAAGTGPSLSNPQNATQSLSAQPTASSSNPPPTTTNLAGSIAPTIVSSGPNFHSGLTPPLPPLSPPPPPTPPLLPHGGHLSPQNPHALSHPQAHDYSKNVVTRLILDGKLAPFYRGFEDWEEEYGEEDIARTLTEVREKDYSDGVGNSVTEAMKLERGAGGGMGSMAKKIGMHRNRQNRMEEEKDERERRERKAYIGATECPICFLVRRRIGYGINSILMTDQNYPPNINTSRCCQQPICSECFVQIRRSEATITHLESEPACCPFCVETDFGVIYERPLPPLASLPQSALATSPETSSLGVSHTPSTGSEDTDLNVGPGMAPKTQETMRRKRVSAKSKEVVTIGESAV